MGSYSKTQRHGRAALEAGGDSFFQEHNWTRVPRLVQWFLTLNCPLNCEHCLAAGEAASGDEMSLKEAARLIEQVAAMGVEEFLLTGGEPFARRDLPDIISILRSNGVRWSLNTAAMPTARTRRATEQWPPYFVAVSLDGPEKVHNAFRGRTGAFRDAMASISYFAELSEHGVAAGTTVTTRNFPHLGETFGLVLESAATTWGLHLLVPEGRAGNRRDLFLDRQQLRHLIRFAAAKRNHFPVTMADEIGYCGLWEPLLRDTPFFCGAGRMHCVVLPDGEVVPCTTLDVSTSAGNIRRKTLAEIWENGFAPLRTWSPKGKCAKCRYAIACQGACWLQRRHGTQCFKAVWDIPQPVKAACFAVCVGLAAAGLAAGDTALARERERVTPKGERSGLRIGRGRTDGPEMLDAERLERHIVRWYASQSSGRHLPKAKEAIGTVSPELAEDPAARYFAAFAEGKLSRVLAERVKLMKAALKTDQRSLSLIALMWRDITEWCLDGEGPEKRTPEERKVLQELLADLHASAKAWREEIFEKKLTPFLRRGGIPGRPMSKAAPRPFRYAMTGRDHNRWGWTIGRRRITKEFLRNHPYADSMQLSYEAEPNRGLKCVRNGTLMAADGRLAIFDVLVVPSLEKGDHFKLTLNIGRQKLHTVLPSDTELTYADVLRLTHEQNKAAVDKPAEASARAYPSTRGREAISLLGLPALHEARKRLEAEAKKDSKRDRERIHNLNRVKAQLADLYLF